MPIQSSASLKFRRKLSARNAACDLFDCPETTCDEEKNQLAAFCRILSVSEERAKNVGGAVALVRLLSTAIFLRTAIFTAID
jgi:hypothetical protein